MTTRTLQTVAVARRRRRSGEFNVRRLFANSEAGAWYDPSDLTAEKVAWRRNLLTWSEDFTNAAWTKNNTTISANAAVAPDGTTTADKLIATATTSVHSMFNAVVTVVPGVVYTASVYVKAAEYNFVAVVNNTIASYNASVCIDLTTGAQSNAGGVGTYTVTNAGNGWWQVSATVAATSTNGYLEAHPRPTAGPANSQFLGDGTSGILLWGAQLDPSPTATAYQRITDFTSDFLAAFPTHALYQDSAGTTPVTALGQPVGLAIDKSRGGLASLGPELVTNGDFSSGGTGWINQDPVRWTFSGGTANHTAGGTLGPYQSIGTVSGKTFLVTFTVTSISAGNVRLEFGGGAAVTASRSTVGTFSQPVFVSSGNGNLVIASSSDFVGSIDNISVREVPGVHAIQPTSASRPLLDGRVNLLERTEEFDNAYWQKAGLGVALVPVVTANAGVAPNGTTTADRFQLDCVNTGSTANRSIVSRALTLTSGTAYAGGVYVKAFDLANVGRTVRFTVEFVQEKLITLTADWQFVALSTLSATGSASNWIVETRGTVTTQTADLLVWGADLRLATDAAYPYQRVAAATDYADVGVPRAFAFDGFDDSLYTASNMDLSGTDKVTVLAGVRKLSDAALGIVAELTNNDFRSFSLQAPPSASARYRFSSTGATTTTSATSAASYAAPITNVLTGQGDINAPSVALRVNAVADGASTLSQGGGNYASSLLYIGRRGNSVSPFNGKAYQLIVRGALTDDATLAQAQRYVGAKTGLYI